MSKSKFAPLMCLLIGLTSCVSLCDIDVMTVQTSSQSVQSGKSVFPCYKESDFNEAFKLCVEAIYSNEFSIRLENYMRDSIGEGKHKNAWVGLTSKDVIRDMKSQLNGVGVDTYGGIKGLWLYIFYGNLAYDGTLDGPIMMNRIPLKGRDIPSISNTIAHEIAHRAGMKHPNSDSNLKIAQKEPPYVIGDIIESIINNR